MRKLEEEERQEDFPHVLKHENLILDVNPKPLPKVEPGETKPLHVDSILNPKTPPFEPSNGPVVSQLTQASESPSHELKSGDFHQNRRVNRCGEACCRTTKNESAPSAATSGFLGKPF